MTKISDATYFLVQLSMLKGIGPAALKKIAALPEFKALNVQELAAHFPALKNAVADGNEWDRARRFADHQVDLASREDVFIVSTLDSDYPANLSETKDDPFLLYIKGRYPLPRVPVVGIIGTRSPTKHGIIVAERITEYFASQGAIILSGLALGCDTIAHTVAVKSSAHTVAVLAHGLHTIAPTSNRQLASLILDSGGTLVSEYPFGVDPRPPYYVQRDKTQAGMSCGIVMVQSDLKGGSLHASRAILKYGRWLSVPYPTETDIRNDEPKSQANLLLAGNDITAKMKLLDTQDQKLLANIIILRGKEDYQHCSLEQADISSLNRSSHAQQLQVPLDLDWQ